MSFLTQASKTAFSPQNTGPIRQAIAEILDREVDADFNYRKTITSALDRLRQQDEPTLHRLENLLAKSMHALEGIPDPENKDPGWHFKLCRFLLAAYFTEQWWPQRSNSSAAIFDPIKQQSEQCEESPDRQFPYAVRLYNVHKNSLSGSPFSSPTEHIDAGLRTARFINKEFLGLVLPVYWNHLLAKERGELVPEDRAVILKIGESTIPIISKLASGDIETSRHFVLSAGSPVGRQTLEIPQKPECYCISEETLPTGERIWSIQQKEEHLRKLEPSQGSGIGCPGSIARTPEGTPVTTALARETYERWKEEILRIPFGDQWSLSRLRSAHQLDI